MMAFKKNFVVSIKCGGKILREVDEFVTLPFGSEYSILVKNLESRTAVINIDIDGQRVCEDVVVWANKSVELERYTSKPFKFKFIEKTQEISDHRGDFIDDGFVRVEFKFVKPAPVYREEIVRRRCDPWYPYSEPYWYTTYYSSTSEPHFGSSLRSVKSSNDSAPQAMCFSAQADFSAVDVPTDNGITVAGSESSQRFTSVNVGELEENAEVIIIRLRGTRCGQPVETPVTVNDKPPCPTCGRKNKSNARFCSNCGTNLTA